MNIHNLDIFFALSRWIEREEVAYLCTVIDTWGSSPRPCGSLMAVNHAGDVIGSLSGGCIEEELIQHLAHQKITQPLILHYGATAEESERLQLPCGGSLRVLLEPLHTLHLGHIQQIIHSLQQYKTVTRHIGFSNNSYAIANEGSAFICESELSTPLTLTHTIGPAKQLFIIGASDVAKALAELAQWMEYQVIVCDPREHELLKWPIKGCTLLPMMPDDGLDAYKNNQQLVIVALTHDPRIDDMGLLAAFESQAAYIGAMGSIRTSEKRRERLKTLGITDWQLLRLRAPVGLNIGSKTPREIAIAIMAELIQA